ncbi:hypothetical protein DXB21_12460 [Bacteroides faecis]|nr:hypothetical protein F2Z43_15400 [Bacteroides faecis]KAA5267267.1 hypothetical protein F2Z41_14490 [Bacteroides faecis]KAA5272695.1 hypothetical protein F2Z14_14285 [Bacteroides faecis]KAA5282244.1 hypothetical protein F2Z12_07045 [Bacteroides faecis]KAA5291138.1 hypothetical protein F2Z11_11985 [Bacteroides faecis]
MVFNHLKNSLSNPLRNNRAQNYFFYLFQTNFSFIFCCFLLKHFTYTLFSFWRYSFHMNF